MKKEFIMSEEERTVKRKKIEENRMKKIKHKPKTKNSKQLIHLLNGGYDKRNDIKSEAESSFSDSDITASPLANSPESLQESLLPLKDTHNLPTSPKLKGIVSCLI